MTPETTEKSTGYRVVLTADRSSMAGYRSLFGGMVSASQTTMLPEVVMKGLLAPPVDRDDLRAAWAPLGLRRVEGALLRDGYERDQVAVVRPGDLESAVGSDTRVIGLASGDPLGVGMNSTTMEGLLGGRIYVGAWFRRLARKVNQLKEQAPSARIVVGGPGAPELADDPEARRGLGIDYVIAGPCEGNVAELIRAAEEDRPAEAVLHGRDGRAEAIPPVQGGVTAGAVELSRGCGLGCRFCSLRDKPMRHLPEDTIIADARTNLRSGAESISLISEDVFRYGSEGEEVRPEALLDLLRRLRGELDIDLIQTDHVNVASVAQFGDAQLREFYRLMSGAGAGQVWVNLGVETASGQLLVRNGGRAKMGGREPDEWGDFCLRQVRRLSGAGIFPLVSLIVGLPGERSGHVRQTRRWVQRLRNEKAAVFPLFYASYEGDGNSGFGVEDMTDEHWRLFKQCYRLNFRWVPGLCRDNQARGGVPLWRRVAVQAAAVCGSLGWRGYFDWKRCRSGT